MQSSLCGLPKANLATFCYGGNKTSVGDAVGKHSLQIWVGWMEPQPAAEISLHLWEAGLFPASLGSGWGSRAVWFGQQLQSLLLGCPTRGGFHQSLGCSVLAVERCSLSGYSQSCPVASQRAVHSPLKSLCCAANDSFALRATWLPKEQPSPKLQEVLL